MVAPHSHARCVIHAWALVQSCLLSMPPWPRARRIRCEHGAGPCWRHVCNSPKVTVQYDQVWWAPEGFVEGLQCGRDASQEVAFDTCVGRQQQGRAAQQLCFTNRAAANKAGALLACNQALLFLTVALHMQSTAWVAVVSASAAQ